MFRQDVQRIKESVSAQASGYLLALAATLTATAVRFLLQRELEEKGRMMLFIPAVLIAAWYGGVGPGVSALLLGALMVAWVIIPPVTNINLGSRADQVQMVLYFLIGIGIILLADRERSEKRAREAVQAELLEANLYLEKRVQDRTAQLMTANQELEGFCYNVSHDLRTPSRAIVGNARILLEDFGGELSDSARSKLLRISSAAVKLSDLVDALLIYARLAKADITVEAVNVTEIIESEFSAQRRERNARVSLRCPEDIVIRADRSQLRIAVDSIISNSLKYRRLDGDGVIEVGVDCSDGDVILSFCDDGIGFDPKYMHKVFEPFERLHRDEDYVGVGMGLANVSRIMSRHRGEVWATSELGKGTTVFLRFTRQQGATIAERQRMTA